MDKFDQLQTLHKILKACRYPVSKKHLSEKLDCESKRVGHLISFMRSRYSAPIDYVKSSDPDTSGYKYVEDSNFEMPGLWLTSQELQALATFLHLIQSIGDGLLNEGFSVIEDQITHLLHAHDIKPDDLNQRLKIIPIANSNFQSNFFVRVLDALLQRKKLFIRYKNYDGTVKDRNISPQQLIHYRDNWYLDAWCDLRQSLRTFHLSRIQHINLLAKENAIEIKPDELQNTLSKGYGIFTGEEIKTATLKFSNETAYDVSTQTWHPKQTGEWKQEHYLLKVPYTNKKELLGDVMKYGANVEVIAPSELREEIKQTLKKSFDQY